MVRVFPTSTNANEYVLLPLGYDYKGRDDVEISRNRGQSACSHRFIHAKPCETNVPVNAVQHAVSSFFNVG